MTMFVASMDHSPQENALHSDQWHTTVLLVSESAEQWAWDKVLGPAINSQGMTLKKWAGRNNATYQAKFRDQFPKLLSDSSVFGLAFSARGEVVAASLIELIAQLGLNNHLAVSADKVKVSGLASGSNFSVQSSQASYVLYLLVFICRMHAMVLNLLKSESSGTHDWCDWQISPDNFPGGSGGPMAQLFSVCANSASALGLVSGNLRVLTHASSDPGVDVCDNVAGMLRQDLEAKFSSIATSDQPVRGGLYWEINDWI